MMGEHRVLVVGSNANLSRDLAALVSAFGHPVDCVDDTAGVSDKLRDGRYRCVVAELDLNDMSGMDLIATLRRSGIWAPAVVIGSVLSLEDKDRADALGVEVVLSGQPPVNWVWKLGNALSRVMRRSSGFMRRVSAEDAEPLEVPQAARAK